MNLEDLPFMMKPEEVAQFLRLSPENGDETVRRLARTKQLKGKKVGGLWRFPREVVVRYANS